MGGWLRTTTGPFVKGMALQATWWPAGFCSFPPTFLPALQCTTGWVPGVGSWPCQDGSRWTFFWSPEVLRESSPGSTWYARPYSKSWCGRSPASGFCNSFWSGQCWSSPRPILRSAPWIPSCRWCACCGWTAQLEGWWPRSRHGSATASSRSPSPLPSSSCALLTLCRINHTPSSPPSAHSSASQGHA